MLSTFSVKAFAVTNALSQTFNIHSMYMCCILKIVFLTNIFFLHFFSFSETCELLVLKGAEVTSIDTHGRTALHLAVKAGSLKTVKIVLNYLLVSTLEARDDDGNTPLHLACRYNRLDILNFFLDKGADVTALNNRKMTCLDTAIEWEAKDVATTLMRHERYVFRS